MNIFGINTAEEQCTLLHSDDAAERWGHLLRVHPLAVADVGRRRDELDGPVADLLALVEPHLYIAAGDL